MSKVHLIKIPKHIKSKKFGKMIFQKYHKRFVFKDRCKINIDIAALMNIIVDRLKEKKNHYYSRNIKYTQIDFINGIIDIVNNNTYWNRYKGEIAGKYINKKHNEYCKLGVYECMYLVITTIYFNKSKYLCRCNV